MEDLKLKDLIYIEKILTDEQCDALIKEREDRDIEGIREQCDHAFTGKITRSTFEQVELIPETENFNIVHDGSETILRNWYSHLKTFNSFYVEALADFTNFSHKYRLMRYKEGGWIHPHMDWHPMCTGSLTIALNDESEYEGGDFVFFNQHKVRLKKGEAMVFPANPFFVHEVREIKKGVRYSVNSFLEILNFEDSRFVNDEVYKRMDLYKQHPSPWQYNLGESNGINY